MSTTTAKRKRAKKACIPCRQRKRKCDAEYPCNMCSTYGYSCTYAADKTTGTARDATHSPSRPECTGINGDSSSKSTTTVEAGASAAMAFPHVLGVALGSGSPPKVHSFAYNFGIRPDEDSRSHGLLGQFISEDELEVYSGVYFSALARVGDFVDPQIYAQRCWDYYHGDGRTAIAFGAVAAGVAALGSFFSSSRHPREAELVQYAKAILEDPGSIRKLGVDHIIAWGMRVFYLRATALPSNAWIASCTAMHLCEALGLHDDAKIQKIASTADAALGHDADRLRRIFWISWSGHTLLCYEYDRSSVHFRTVTCQAISARQGSVADQFVQLAQIIPSPNSPFQLACQPSTPQEELFERLKALDKLHVTDLFLVVTKADLAFCFYRRIYQLKMGIPDEMIQLVIGSGNAAVESAGQLASHGRLFWNAIGSVFQYACVLLAIDTAAASIHVATAFKGLKNLVDAADTKLTREAWTIAQHLLSLHTTRKREQLAQLEPFETADQVQQPQLDLESTATLPDMNWDLDWDQFFLEPFPSIFSRDV